MTGPADGHAAHDHAARRDSLRAVLPEGVAAILVSGLANVRWLSGLVASHALLVVARDGVDTLATDERYRGPAERLVADQDLGLAIGRDPVVAALDPGQMQIARVIEGRYRIGLRTRPRSAGWRHILAEFLAVPFAHPDVGRAVALVVPHHQ
jgi:Xaa-Pro aminopeptidase